MNSNEIQILMNNIKGQLVNKQIAPLCLAGSPGTTKSTTVELVAKQLGMGIVTESGPTLSHEILTGLPDTVPAERFQYSSIDGSVPQATVWSIPEMVAKTLRTAENKPTVLLIDDFHMVSPHLQSYFYGLLLERRLGNYRLPDNVALVLTMNDSDAAGFQGINSAVRNRLSILKIEFNFEYWFKNYGNRLHYLVASFLKAYPDKCQEEETTGIEGYATARAWSSIAAELAIYDEESIKKQARRIAGMQVSSSIAQAFQSHVNYVSALDFTKLVKNRELVNLADSKDPLDAIVYAYITNFIYTIDDGIYLIDLMEHNKGEASSAFIGFVTGELHTKYLSETKLSEGLEYVIDRITSTPMDKSKYPNTSKDKLEKAFDKRVPSLTIFQNIAAEFLF